MAYNFGVFKQNIKVLHIAPEKNLMKIFKKLPNIEYISGDKFEGDNRYSDNRYGNSMYIDVQKIPLNNELFDVVICNHVLEHVPDDIKAMKEIARVTKRRGYAILQAPISYKLKKTMEDPNVKDSKERAKRFGQVDHVRIYGNDYTKRLKLSGFCVIKDIKSKQEFKNINLDYYGINPLEHIYICYP